MTRRKKTRSDEDPASAAAWRCVARVTATLGPENRVFAEDSFPRLSNQRHRPKTVVRYTVAIQRVDRFFAGRALTDVAPTERVRFLAAKHADLEETAAFGIGLKQALGAMLDVDRRPKPVQETSTSANRAPWPSAGLAPSRGRGGAVTVVRTGGRAQSANL